MRRIRDQLLWIGNVGDVRDLKNLYSNGIAAVVDVAINESPALLPHEMVYCRFPLIDGADNSPVLVRAAIECLANLIRSKVPTLVYCSGGMSRSPCIAAAALSIVSGCSPNEALEWVTESGPKDVSPLFWQSVQWALSGEPTKQVSDS